MCEIKIVEPKGLSFEEGGGHFKKPSIGEGRAQLGMVVPYYLNSRRMSILLRRSRRKSCAAILECK